MKQRNFQFLLIIRKYYSTAYLILNCISSERMIVLKISHTTSKCCSVYDWFFILDERVNKGNITKLRKQYIRDFEILNPTG